MGDAFFKSSRASDFESLLEPVLSAKKSILTKMEQRALLSTFFTSLSLFPFPAPVSQAIKMVALGARFLEYWKNEIF